MFNQFVKRSTNKYKIKKMREIDHHQQQTANIEQTIELNLKHFLVSPIVECPEHAAYDQFVQFVNKHHHVFTKSKSVTIKQSVDNVLLNVEILKSCVYLSKCIMNLFALYLQDESNFNSCLNNGDKDSLFEEKHLLQLLNVANVENKQVFVVNPETDSDLHEEDETVLRIAAIDAISLLTNHSSALKWIISNNVIHTVVYNGLRHPNLYVKDAAANLFARIVYLDTILGQVTTVDIEKIKTELIDKLYRDHTLEFLDFVLILVDFAFHTLDSDETLLHIQLSRLSLENESSLSLAQVIESFLIKNLIITNHVMEILENGSVDHQILTRASDIIISLSKSHLSDGKTSAVSLVSKDGFHMNRFVSILKKLLSKDEFSIDLATRTICSLNTDLWKIDSEKQATANLITILFELLQALLVITIIQIQDEQIVNKIQSLSAKRKSKLLGLVLKSLCNIINEKTVMYCTGNIYQFLVTIVQEYELVYSGVYVMVLRVLISYENALSNSKSGSSEGRFENEFRQQLFHRFNSSNSPTIVSLIGQALPKLCKESTELQTKV
jgi:hypothetical protein